MQDNFPKGHTPGPHAETDARLLHALQLCAQGDRAAFAELYTLTSRPFGSVVLRLVGGDTHHRDDVLQQGYVRIWERAGSFDPARGRAFSWMLVVMRNVAIDSHRSRARTHRETAMTPALEATLADGAPAPDVRVGRTELAARLEAGLGGLREEVSLVLRMHYLGGASYADIARGLGRSEHTVRSWARRGLAGLRGELEAGKSGAGELSDWV